VATKKLDIATYNRKRDFTKTKEPKGRKLKGKGDSFVVQKHEASRLHYDFRLELDGVLKSWAVPKGPSLDPDEKRLAMRTEDHPLDYGDFEGSIPAGEYGGGTVMLWDQGRWIPHPDKDPRKTLEEGHLHFTLEGERMKGEWVMFRLNPRRGEKGEPWMLKKVTDDFANPDNGDELVDEFTTSVTTDRTMAEIASGADVWRSNRGGQKGGRARKKASEAPPPFEQPQLATLVDEVPPGPNWLFEYKYDGYRLLIATGTGAATAWTRNGKDWSDKFRALVRAAAKLPAGCLIDGEAVALDDEGKPSFQLLQSTLHEGRGANLAFYAFDLLIDRGQDIKRLPNVERKDRLKSLLAEVHPPILFGDHVIGRGEDLFREICKAGGEGLIAKKSDAPYRGERSKNWLKVKCIQRQEFVIIGWSESDKRRGFRSLLLGTRDGRAFTYAGKVGTGFSADLIEELMEKMEPLQTEMAAAEVPRAERKGAHWVKPELVAEINFAEFTSEGILRHPSFVALREDKPAKEVVREVPQQVKSRKKAASHKTPASYGIEISNPDRVIYPKDGVTKGDLANYYAAVDKLIMPTVADRPMTLIRCPQGTGEKCFFQKHDSGTFGEHVKHVPIEEKDGDMEDYLFLDDVRGVLACVQMGTIEFHGWGSSVPEVDYPDRLVFDLDPDEGLDFAAVREAAVSLRELLLQLGLKTFPMLTGGKGVHVIAPLDRSAHWDDVSDFAERFSRAVAEADPDRFTANIRKVQRKGRIFLDWLRNQRGSTAVMPYSARAREGAPVAAPIAWDELDQFAGGNAFSIRDLDHLLERARSKALAGWGKAKQSLPDA
jgi:bifunctional non-homologous end joining protein LigD